MSLTKQSFNQKYPFTSKHFVKFKRELRRVGDFNTLMVMKHALEIKNGLTFIGLYKNIEEYKTKYLRGKYATLRPHYNTEVPYVFWSKLYMEFVKKCTQHGI